MEVRNGSEGLAALMREEMKCEPFCGTIYIFHAKRADREKLNELAL